ncbi:MAG: glutamate racemase [bacterium]
MSACMSKPIGIFDSGVGGLSLLRELDNLLPFEDFLYFGDTLRVPYGTRAEKTIVGFSNEAVRFMVKEKGCKMIIIACNTVSGLLPERSEMHGVPVVGVINYGCVAAALYVTYNFRMGVLATRRTIQSGVYRKVMDGFDPTVKIFARECTDLIPMIEDGMIGSPETRRTAEKYLVPLLRKDIDTLILGCTHLPFIRRIIQDITGPAVTIVDPARRTAVLAMKVLQDYNLMKKDRKKPGARSFFVTGSPTGFERTAALLGMEKMVENTARAVLSRARPKNGAPRRPCPEQPPLPQA